MPSSQSPITVFYSYANEDKEWREELEKHLHSHRNVIRSWHREMTHPGAEVEQQIQHYLEMSDLIVVFLSPNYFASDYYSSFEMQQILKRFQGGAAFIFPILVRTTDLTGTPFVKLQIFPENGEAISLWRDRDRALLQIIYEIDKVIERLYPDRGLLDSLGPDFKARQLAISQVAKADPANIQEVAASQLSIINSYYQSALQQSKQSFNWSLIWAGVGLCFLIAAVSLLLLQQSTSVAFASGIGGTIVEVLAGTYLYLYKHASDQLAAFRTSLEGTQRLLLANSMCEKLEGEIEQNTRAELIRLMVSSVVNGSASATYEKKTERI